MSSLTLGAGVSILVQYPFHIGYVIGLTFGSLLPDIDEPNSYIGKRSFGLASYVKRKYGHRGITHSLFIWSLLSLICSFYPSPFTIGISLGYIFHLIGDFFSILSIPLFAPFSNYRPKIPFSYKTGSRTETLLLYIFTLILFYFVFILGKLHIFLIYSIGEFSGSVIRSLIELIYAIIS
ncbi:metal-dependent hydrolase [Cytobacillus firmus]|uniref:metal-dependent hydrolase n=1 Tax=Cytobacillus firmus TaxID=1399 RepID=UPI0037C18DC5